jgi:hypothetical protein
LIFGGANYNPDLDAIYERLSSLREERDDAEFMRDRPSQRMHELADTWETYDDASSDLRDAVREARQAGMGWDRIAEALGVSPDEASARFGTDDRA